MKVLAPPPSGLCFLLIWTSAAVWAGPLDRNDAGPRYNPATVNMLRVPGVVGLDYHTALATLQQAGLNPRIHFIRDPQKRYRGRAGEVVKQLPVSGGVAMLGASVSLQVYDPGHQGQSPADQGPAPQDPEYGQPPNTYPSPTTDYGVPAVNGGPSTSSQGVPPNGNQPTAAAGGQQPPPAGQSDNGNGWSAAQTTGPDAPGATPNPDPLWQPSPPPATATSGAMGQPTRWQPAAGSPSP